MTSFELGESEGDGRPKIDILLGGCELMVPLSTLASCGCSVSSARGPTGSTAVPVTKADRAKGTREAWSVCFGDSFNGLSKNKNGIVNWLNGHTDQNYLALLESIGNTLA